MKASTVLASAVALALVSPLAFAHKAGDVVVRAGAAMVNSQTDSSEIKVNGAKVAGSEATVNDNTQLGLTLSYMLSDHVGIELLAATPFTHRVGVKGVGAGIDGKLADVKHLPPTVSVQYFPLESSSKWQPYVGVGVNYTTFFDEKLTSAQKANGFSSLSLSDSWGLALQVGSDIMITDKLMLNAAVWYVDINTTASARLGGVNKVKVDVEIDPWVFMLGVGYKF